MLPQNVVDAPARGGCKHKRARVAYTLDLSAGRVRSGLCPLGQQAAAHHEPTQDPC